MKGLAYLQSEGQVQHCAVEVFDEAIGAGRADPGSCDARCRPERDRVRTGARVCAAELAAVVGQDGADLEPDALVEWQYVVVHHSATASGCLEAGRTPKA